MNDLVFTKVVRGRETNRADIKAGQIISVMAMYDGYTNYASRDLFTTSSGFRIGPGDVAPVYLGGVVLENILILDVFCQRPNTPLWIRLVTNHQIGWAEVLRNDLVFVECEALQRGIE